MNKEQKQYKDMGKEIPKQFSSTPTNFVVTWDKIDMGYLNGRTFNTATFDNAEQELVWVNAQILYAQSLLEKLAIYCVLRVREIGIEQTKKEKV